MKSFTIIEMLIALLISAIVISISYSALLMLNRQFGRFQSRAEQIKQFRLLSLALMRDVERADWIRDTIDESHLVFGCPDTVVYYSIQPDGYIQRTLSIGGFATVNDSIGIKSEIAGLEFVNDTTGLINRITLRTVVNGEQLLLSENKEYSVQQVMVAEQ